MIRRALAWLISPTVRELGWSRDVWQRRAEERQVTIGNLRHHLDGLQRDHTTETGRMAAENRGLVMRLADLLEERDREAKRADRMAIEVEQLRTGAPAELLPVPVRTEGEREAYWRRKFEQERANNAALSDRMAKLEGRPC